MNNLSALLREDLVSGQSAMADFMKILVYQNRKSLFELLPFDNDSAFLEPLLFSHFSNSLSEVQMPLDQILFSYLSDEEKSNGVKVLSDAKGMVYVPKIGYFFTNIKGKSLQFRCVNNEYQFQDCSFYFIPCLSVANEQIELLQYPISFYEPSFTDYRIANESFVTIEVEQTVRRHQQSIVKALAIIETNDSDTYGEILYTNKVLSVFHNPRVLCFVNIGTHGCSYLTTIPSNDEVFFLEEIIHQCSHNTFNAILFEKEKWFKIDVDQVILGTLSGNENDERSVLSAFHGLYTVTKRYESFLKIYENHSFNECQEHEFLGRLADLQKRVLTGLEKIDAEMVFTPKGVHLLNTMFETCLESIKKVKDLGQEFDLSNQPDEFSYAHFLALNPIDIFLSKKALVYA